MQRHPYILARLLAGLLALAMLALCGTAMVRDRRQPAGEISWEDMDPAQLSWVIEGIQERISALQDDLARAIKAQREKLNE